LIITPGLGFKNKLNGNSPMASTPFIVKKEGIDEIADKLDTIIRESGHHIRSEMLWRVTVGFTPSWFRTNGVEFFA
jgi:hypothetical protein